MIPMKTFTCKALALAGLILSLGLLDGRADDLAIIVNKAAKLEDVSYGDLQKYFKADKTKTPDGTKLVIVVQDVGRPERDAALAKIYKMSEAEYTDYWVSQTFTGAVAAAPKALPNAAAMKKYVSNTPGAIGFIRASDADDSVKVVKVDGKSPGEADYKLK